LSLIGFACRLARLRGCRWQRMTLEM